MTLSEGQRGPVSQDALSAAWEVGAPETVVVLVEGVLNAGPSRGEKDSVGFLTDLLFQPVSEYLDAEIIQDVVSEIFWPLNHLTAQTFGRRVISCLR